MLNIGLRRRSAKLKARARQAGDGTVPAIFPGFRVRTRAIAADEPAAELLGGAVMTDNAQMWAEVRQRNLAALPAASGAAGSNAGSAAPTGIRTGASTWFNSEAAPRNEEWRIKIENESFHFVRYVNGKPNESYRHVGAAVASIWAAAIIQGFEPPRHLSSSDRPPG